jgi:UDP-glucose 4-epimerase
VVDLVLFAYTARPGRRHFCAKSPAATIGQLARWVLQDIFNARNEVRIIGTRHGGK